MKIRLIILIVFFGVAPVFGQQVMQLKSGEKMNGKIEKIIGDTIVFNFKGNKLKLVTSEIGAIYFDEKLLNPEQQKITQAQKQDAHLSGVVTYFFNDNYGDKPDVGAKIYILDTSKVSGFNPRLIFNFHYGYSYRNMAATYKAIKKEIPIDITKSIEEFGVETDEKFKQLESEATTAFIMFTMAATEVTADGNGTYSKTLTPGTYIVIIQSAHRKNINTIESRGVIEYNTITIKPGEEKNLGSKFSLN